MTHHYTLDQDYAQFDDPSTRSWHPSGETQPFIAGTAPRYEQRMHLSFEGFWNEDTSSFDRSLATMRTQTQDLPTGYAAGQQSDQREAFHQQAETSRPIETAQCPPRKRPKFDRNDAIIQHEFSDFASEIQSECCSSCPSGPACDEADCPAQVTEEVVVPCTQNPCDQPGRVNGRRNMCSTTSIWHELAWNNQLNPDWRTADWVSTPWIPQVSNNGPELRETHNNDSYQPLDQAYIARMGQHVHYPGCPAAIPQFMGIDNHNACSTGTLRTPSFQTPAPPNLQCDSETMLQGTGGMFQQEKTGGRQDLSMRCLWANCNGDNLTLKDLYAHIHESHLDPLLSYLCPMDSPECSQVTYSNIMEHLRINHEWNISACPDTSCVEEPPDHCDPAWLHNHLDQDHSNPPQEGLYCKWNNCNSVLKDAIQFDDHLNTHHDLWVPMIEGEIDLNDTTTASPLIDAIGQELTCVPDLDMKSHDPDLDTKPLDDQPPCLTCQWQVGEGVCGVIKNGEDAARELQDHVKLEHLGQLSSKTGYICKWQNCKRIAMDINKQGFTQRGKLERHIASHTNYKCCECTVCGDKFSAPQALKQHMNLHSNEKPWKCQYCDKSFPQQSAKTIHERTHTGEKPLQCEICSKTFSESSNLAKHRKTHGERGAHVCKIPGCNKAFHRFDQLTRHHKSKHGKKMANGEGTKLEDFYDETSTTWTSELGDVSSVSF